MRVIRPGSHEDSLTFAQLCERLGGQIIEANPNHTAHHIVLYRPIDVNGRMYFVRSKFTVPFLSVVPS